MMTGMVGMVESELNMSSSRRSSGSTTGSIAGSVGLDNDSPMMSHRRASGGSVAEHELNAALNASSRRSSAGSAGGSGNSVTDNELAISQAAGSRRNSASPTAANAINNLNTLNEVKTNELETNNPNNTSNLNSVINALNAVTMDSAASRRSSTNCQVEMSEDMFGGGSVRDSSGADHDDHESLFSPRVGDPSCDGDDDKCLSEEGDLFEGDRGYRLSYVVNHSQKR